MLRSTLIFVAVFLVLLLATTVSTAPTSTDQCDWTGSGGSGKGVRPVYLRCSRGTVSWRYPRGALRVVLSGGEGFNGFHACVKVSGPARVYLEGKTSLRPVYSPNDGKHESYHRCFRSNGKLAALYVEADESSPDYKWKVVQLQYDLEREEKKEENECMPCSKEELAKTYCQSDLVARGTLSAVEKKTDLDDLVLRVTKILSDINEDNEVDANNSHVGKEVRIKVPSKCDARHGQGEFVIMARKRLGDLTLACAPRLETWAEAVREMKTAPCVLRT